MQSYNRKFPEDAELRRLVASGLGRRDLARRIGCQPETLRVKLKSLGLVAPLDTIPRMDPENLPKVRVPRLAGPISLPAISMFLETLNGERS